MKTLFVAVALIGALVHPAAAEDEIAFFTPGDPVLDHPAITYADLIKQVIPDFGLNADADWVGTLPDGIRHIDGPDTVGEKPEELKIGNVDVRQLEADGHKNLWVMADLNGGGMLGMYTLLMVFDDSASPKLLDAAEVDTDQLTGFLGAQLRISARDEAITVDSEHSNSSQTYQDQSLLFVYRGKLARLAEFFAFGTRTCTYSQTEFVDVRATPGGKGFCRSKSSIRGASPGSPKATSAPTQRTATTVGRPTRRSTNGTPRPAGTRPGQRNWTACSRRTRTSSRQSFATCLRPSAAG